LAMLQRDVGAMDVSRALQMRAGFWQRCLHDFQRVQICTAVSRCAWLLS
jgi:hypothetical protein